MTRLPGLQLSQESGCKNAKHVCGLPCAFNLPVTVKAGERTPRKWIQPVTKSMLPNNSPRHFLTLILIGQFNPFTPLGDKRPGKSPAPGSGLANHPCTTDADLSRQR